MAKNTSSRNIPHAILRSLVSRAFLHWLRTGPVHGLQSSPIFFCNTLYIKQPINGFCHVLNISRSREVARRGHPALAPRRRRRRPRPSRSRRRRRRWRRWRSRRRRRWRRLEHGGRWVSLKVVEMNIIHFDSTPFLIYFNQTHVGIVSCVCFLLKGIRCAPDDPIPRKTITKKTQKKVSPNSSTFLGAWWWFCWYE